MICWLCGLKFARVWFSVMLMMSFVPSFEPIGFRRWKLFFGLPGKPCCSNRMVSFAVLIIVSFRCAFCAISGSRERFRRSWMLG